MVWWMGGVVDGMGCPAQSVRSLACSVRYWCPSLARGLVNIFIEHQSMGQLYTHHILILRILIVDLLNFKTTLQAISLQNQYIINRW